MRNLRNILANQHTHVHDGSKEAFAMHNVVNLSLIHSLTFPPSFAVIYIHLGSKLRGQCIGASKCVCVWIPTFTSSLSLSLDDALNIFSHFILSRLDLSFDIPSQNLVEPKMRKLQQ